MITQNQPIIFLLYAMDSNIKQIIYDFLFIFFYSHL